MKKRGSERVTEYNDMYSEEFRKYKVSTDFGTVLKLRPLLKQLGLDKLLSSGRVEPGELTGSIMKALAEANVINEFCQIVTQTDVDFIRTETFGTIAWVIDDFFVGLYWSMPPSWRARISQMIATLVEIGKAALNGGTIPTTGLTASESEN